MAAQVTGLPAYTTPCPSPGPAPGDGPVSGRASPQQAADRPHSPAADGGRAPRLADAAEDLPCDRADRCRGRLRPAPEQRRRVRRAPARHDQRPAHDPGDAPARGPQGSRRDRRDARRERQLVRRPDREHHQPLRDGRDRATRGAERERRRHDVPQHRAPRRTSPPRPDTGDAHSGPCATRGKARRAGCHGARGHPCADQGSQSERGRRRLGAGARRGGAAAGRGLLAATSPERRLRLLRRDLHRHAHRACPGPAQAACERRQGVEPDPRAAGARRGAVRPPADGPPRRSR